MMKTLFFIFVLSIVILAQPFFTQKDKEVCESKFNLAVDKNLSGLSINDIITEIGKSFIGLDYKSHTLEREGEENLVINLTGLDCTTFLENCLVLARCIKANKNSFQDYVYELTKIRYRDGIIDQYPSRLHYFSDWIYDNSKKGFIKDITKELGGISYPFNVSFMSKNPRLYAQLNSNPKFVNVISNLERQINSREYFYIPKKDITKIESKIDKGNLLAITTSIDGLDISHVGIAIKGNDNRIYLMHAPKEGEKVQISKKPLAEYLAGNKKQTGIMVIKALNPEN